MSHQSVCLTAFVAILAQWPKSEKKAKEPAEYAK